MTDTVYLLEGKGKDKSLERSVSVAQGIKVKLVSIIPIKLWCL